MDVSWLALLKKMASDAKIKKKHAKKEKKGKKESKKACKKAKVVSAQTAHEPSAPMPLPDVHIGCDPLPLLGKETKSAKAAPVGVIPRSHDAVSARLVVVLGRCYGFKPTSTQLPWCSACFRSSRFADHLFVEPYAGQVCGHRFP